MKKWIFLVFIFLFSLTAQSQKIDSIFFHLYTDSLKKGFFNYINVDGKMSDGSWRPLDTSHVNFTCNTGYFLGNDLFIDSSYLEEKVLVKAVLRSNPKIWKEVVIYIRKRGFDEPLKDEKELLKNR
jgi:hypothetical protein